MRWSRVIVWYSCVFDNVVDRPRVLQCKARVVKQQDVFSTLERGFLFTLPRVTPAVGSPQ